jgi:hypothetical protein
MRVSVVVPLYNKAKYILRTLDSIAAQTLRDCEIIVVDDGSTDGGDAIVAQYRDDRLRLIRQANAGPGAARNRGGQEARAPYVAFLDADDCWRPGYLENGVRMLEAHPQAAAVSGGWFDYPGEIPCAKVWRARGISEGVHRVTVATPAGLLATRAIYMTPPTTMLRLVEFRRWGGFEERNCRFAEDSMLWLKMLLHSPVCFYLSPLADLHREASALSGNYRGPRPVEPYLADPSILRGVCPPELRDLLDRFYAVRACKTACMLSYWGEWRQARELLRGFVSLRDWRAPWFFAAMAAATPPGGWLGRRLSARREWRGSGAARDDLL